MIEQLDYNLLFRWFVGLPMDAPRWDPALFSKNRVQLLTDEVTARFLAIVLSHPRVKLLLSDDHFSPDHRLIAAWGLPKSLQTRHRHTPPGPERNKECDSYGENGERLPYYPARPTVSC